MDLIILSLLNVFLFTSIAVWEYSLYIKKKEGFYSRISQQMPTKFNIFLLFLPSSLFHPAEKWLSKVSTKNQQPKSLTEEFTLPKLILLNGAIVIFAFNISTLFKIPFYMPILIGLIGQVGLYFFSKNQQKKTKESIEKKLPEILDIMARVYRVHTDMRITLREVSRNMHDLVIKEKFNQMVSLSRFGYTIEEAMVHVGKEIKSADFDFIITSIKLNIPVGGDLPQLFEHTAKLLRQRKEAKNEIQNLMFQSKISAIISALLVPAIIFVAFTTSKRYQEVLLYNTTGRLVFFACLFWWLIGVVMIRKNSRIKI